VSSATCVHFSQLETIVQHRHTPHNAIENTHAKISISTLEHQVSWCDSNGEVVDYYCNLTYASKLGE
jgi:hypothetical protein